MANELPDYLIGDKGVQLTPTPLHTPDSGLLVAENVEFFRDGGIGGIASRRSLTPLNLSNLGGVVNHLANLPFTYPSVKILMVGLNSGETGLSWLSSPDGTTFTSIATTVLNRIVNQNSFKANVSSFLHPGNFYMPQRTASFRRRIYFGSDDYTVWYSGIVSTPTRPPIEQYQGLDGLELFRLPDNPTATAGSFPQWIMGIWVFNGLMWLLVLDPGGVAPNLKGRVLTFDPLQGTIALVGNRFGNGTGENTKGMPYALASFAGRMFCGTMGISGDPAGGVYSILAGVENTWTLDRAMVADDGYCMDLLPYKGSLYMATSCDASGTARVDKRTSAGVWSASFTAPATNVAYCGGLIEFEGNLFCAFCGINSGGTVYMLVKKFDGTSWTTDKDVGTDYAVTNFAPGTPLVFEGALYWPWYDATSDTALTGFLLKRTAGGVWSKVLNNRGIRGGLGFYRDEVDPTPAPPEGGGFSSGFSSGF